MVYVRCRESEGKVLHTLMISPSFFFPHQLQVFFIGDWEGLIYPFEPPNGGQLFTFPLLFRPSFFKREKKKGGGGLKPNSKLKAYEKVVSVFLYYYIYAQILLPFFELKCDIAVLYKSI